MTGKFLQADPERDEWTVEIDLFGVGTKVTFQRNEIEM
jgi:transcription antitermination factor NusG